MYTAKVIEKIDNGKGYWKCLKIGVFEQDKQVGEYIRNYSSLYNTFYPFKYEDNWYALCSKNYTCTTVISLPDCKEIATENPNQFGFCPTDFFVPKKSLYIIKDREGKSNLNWWNYDVAADDDSFIYDIKNAFVAGCVWGDDFGGWKIQSLDLSQFKQGIINRSEKYGYIELPNQLRLGEAIRIFEYYYEDGGEDTGPFTVEIPVINRYNIKTGEKYNA